MCACITCSNIYLMGGVSDVCLMGGVSEVCLMGGVSEVCLMGGVSGVCLMGGVSGVCLMGGVSDVCLMGGVSDVCLMGGVSDVCLMGGVSSMGWRGQGRGCSNIHVLTTGCLLFCIHIHADNKRLQRNSSSACYNVDYLFASSFSPKCMHHKPSYA